MSLVSNLLLNKKLLLGYCCLNMHLRNLGIFTSRTCRLQTILDKGIEYSYELATNNLNDLACILRWNQRNNIHLYRMSSEMFPFATHPDYYKVYNLDVFQQQFTQLRSLIKRFNQRVTFHPGQYNQLTSCRPEVVEKAIIDIDFHALILDLLGVGSEGVIIIHGGSKQDGKDNALDRLRKNFKRLSTSSQNRLVLENCELVYSIEDLLPVCEELSIPLVIDYHHHNINPGTINIDLLTQKVLDIWKKRNITPLFHVSESKPNIKITDSITARRAHSDYINGIPAPLIKAIEQHNVSIHIDVEAKMKEQAVLYIYDKYM
jgi:UV DNA damage endonuclease